MKFLIQLIMYFFLNPPLFVIKQLYKNEFVCTTTNIKKSASFEVFIISNNQGIPTYQ